MRILYVEDNPANVFLVKRVAKMGNHEIINYIDGGEALRKFPELKPDLVLMDVQLSGELSGLDVVRRLRADGYTTPIIAVTAYAMVGDRERCIEAGCNDYLAKPLPIPRLVEIFEQYEATTTAPASTDDNRDVTPPAPMTDNTSETPENAVESAETHSSGEQQAEQNEKSETSQNTA
jgi:two-component system, cell cycle response regulator DivK